MSCVEATHEAAFASQGGHEEGGEPVRYQSLGAQPGGARDPHQAKAQRLPDRSNFATRWATEPLDLLRELRELKPTLVHFSGHGARPSLDDRSGGPRFAAHEKAIFGARFDRRHVRRKCHRLRTENVTDAARIADETPD
jgi:hypothetical protein